MQPRNVACLEGDEILPPLTGAEPQSDSAIVISPVVLQLKRLTRDLRVRVQDFRILLSQVIDTPTPADHAGLEMLAGQIARMREQLQVSGEIAAASRSAMARSDPAELIVLRDQLLVYLATLESARQGGVPSDVTQTSSFAQTKTGSLTSHRPE